MKKDTDCGAAQRTEMDWFDGQPSHEYPRTANLATRLQQSHAALTELKEALARKDRQSVAAQKEMVQLTQENSRLRQELMNLAQREAQANHFAYHDELTGLPNRRLLRDRFTQAIAQAARRGKQVVLLFFDLDGFKQINDRLGHMSGDKLLREIAQRLQLGLRGADTASRYGGDEFVIMLPEIDDAEHASAVEQKLRARLDRPYVVDGHTLTVSISVGCAVYPDDGKSYSELIKRADDAMYHAKGNGTCCRKNSR